MPNELIKNITSIGILFLLFLVFHSKFKKQSVMDSLRDIKSGIKELFGQDE